MSNREAIALYTVMESLKELDILRTAAPELAKHCADLAEKLRVAREALEECEDFFDNRSDINEDGRPNFAMKLLDKVRLALRTIDSEPVSQPTP